MYDVFISYSRSDENIANNIVEYLESKGLKCFIDHRNIRVGESYSKEIIHAIENTKALVVLLTSKSNNSHNVVKEVDNAANLKKRIIVFRKDNIELSKSLQFYLSTSHWLEAFQWKPSTYYEQLHCIIKELPVPPIARRTYIGRKIIYSILLLYALISTISFVIWGIPILKDYFFLSKKNSQNIKFIDAIKYSGLVDIETDNKENSYPLTTPEELISLAKKEIFISGTTMRNTLEKDKDIFRDALKKGVKIKLLFLHPKSKDSIVVYSINNRFQSWQSSINGSIAIMCNDTALFNHPNVEVRFIDYMPPLKSIIIDGDIGNIESPIIENAYMKIMPYFRSAQHNDWFLHFKHTRNSSDAFVDFSNEFRYYWKQAKKINVNNL